MPNIQTWGLPAFWKCAGPWSEGRQPPWCGWQRLAPGRPQWALEGGAKGILFPRVRSVDEARQAVSFCRYPPEGQRGLGPGRASVYGTDIPGYAATANQEILTMIQIETLEAVDCLEEIAAIPGVDLLFIGPGDLSHALGLSPGNCIIRGSWR